MQLGIYLYINITSFHKSEKKPKPGFRQGLRFKTHYNQFILGEAQKLQQDYRTHCPRLTNML